MPRVFLLLYILSIFRLSNCTIQAILLQNFTINCIYLVYTIAIIIYTQGFESFDKIFKKL